MSTNTLDESPDINKKKNEKEGKSETDEFTWENTKKYLSSVVYLIIMVLGYFGLSGFILFACKVAQANLMPTSANCAPYEKIDPTFNYNNDSNETTCNIFETIFEDPKSEKIYFSYSDNKKYNFLDWLRNVKIGSESIITYLIYSIVETIFVFDFNCLNIFLNFLNGLPEWLVILFGPIVFLFCACIVVGLSSIYYILLSLFMPFQIFLKTKVTSFNQTDIKNFTSLNDNLQKSGYNFEQLPEKYKWREVGGYEWWLRLLFALILLLFAMVYFTIAAPLCGLIMILCLISLFTYIGHMKNPDEGVKQVGVFKIAGETYGQYKRLIVFILTVLVVLSTFANLGTVTGVISIITVISIYFGWVPIKVFEKFDYENLDRPVDDTQTEKTCSMSDVEIKLKGLIPDYNIFGSSLFDWLWNWKIPVRTSSKGKGVASKTGAGAAATTVPDTAATTVPDTGATTAADNTTVPDTGATTAATTVPNTVPDYDIDTNPDLGNKGSSPPSVTSIDPDMKPSAPLLPTDTNTKVDDTVIPASAPSLPIDTNTKGDAHPPSYEDATKTDQKGGRKIKNKSLSKYKNKYNVLNYK